MVPMRQGMWRDPRRLVAPFLLVAALLPLRLGLHPATVHSQTAPREASLEALLTPAVRRAGPTFAPDVQAADRQAILTAIAGARPEARRLLDLVDGLVTIRVGPTGGQTVGLTSGFGGHFEMGLDLGFVYRGWGSRGVSRLVLHEFGHVIDAVLVPEDLKSRLDAEIPAGYPCDPGQPFGACAPRAERFAETFAKWATGDLGVDINLGYKVLAPTSLEDWGAPLAALGPR